MRLKNVFKLVFVVLISSNSLKAQIFDLSLEDLVKNSAFIVHCKLKNIQSYFNENTKRIYTDIYFENVSSIKGNIQKSEPIKITLYGGTYKGITTFSPDYPSFNLNEESILFLNAVESKIPAITKYSIYGSYLGKFDIKKDELINDLIVLRNKGISELKLDNTKGEIVVDNKNKLRLGSFFDMIKFYQNNK